MNSLTCNTVAVISMLSGIFVSVGIAEEASPAQADLRPLVSFVGADTRIRQQPFHDGEALAAPLGQLAPQ